MANSAFASNGLLGANYLSTYSATAVGANTISHRLGQREEGTNGSEWIFCFSAGGITGPGYAAGVDAAFNATLLTTANAGGMGLRVGIATVAWPANSYGWLQFSGPLNAMLAAGTAARAQLNTTTNPGVLGSDATTGSFKVNGLTAIAAQVSLGLGAVLGPAAFSTGTVN
jgi:hypothetical protein